MKKVIVLIAVLTLGFASVWGENYNVVSQKNSDVLTAVPFNVKVSTRQIMEFIIPASDISSQVTVGNTSAVTNSEFDFFEQISFFSNQNIMVVQNCNNCTISVKSLGATVTDFNSLQSAVTGTTVYANCTVTANQITDNVTYYKMTIALPNSEKFYYKKADGSLYIRVDITLGNEHTITADGDYNWQANVPGTGETTYLYANRNVEIENNQTETYTTGNGLPKIQLEGGRILTFTYEGSTYSATTHSSKYESTLIDFNQSTKETKYLSNFIPVNSTISNPAANEVTGDLYTIYSIKEFTSPFTIDNETHGIPVKHISNDAFKNKSLGNCVIVFETPLTDIGTVGGTNECFNFANSTEETEVILVFNNSIPTLNGDLTNFLPNKTTSNTKVKLRAGVSYLNNSAPFSTWTSTVTNQFTNVGWSYHPFMIAINNIHKNNEEEKEVYENVDNKSNHTYIEVSQYPFETNDHTINLTVRLTGIGEPAHDGSWCYYDTITRVVRDSYSGTISDDKKSASIRVPSENKTVNIYSKYHTDIVYGKGDPFFDYTDNKTSVFNKNSQPVLFYKSPKLTFKLDTTMSGCDITSYNNNNVPHWKYTDAKNSVGTPSSLHYDGVVQVEKLITSAHYRYFSLPFDCPVSSIEVHKVNADKTLANGTIPFLTQSIDDLINNGWSGYNTDHFVIEEYLGQQDGADYDGLPNYRQITNHNETLSKNKGYSFAIVEGSGPVEAVITFKSAENSVDFYLNTYNGFEIPLTSDNAENPRNQGWRMIGNPFYHEIPAYYYYTVNSSSEEKSVKYITKINDNDNETVTHYYVGEAGNYQEGEIKYSSVSIKPFEPFFIQAELNQTDNAITAKVNPAATAPQSLPAEQPKIKEIVSVKVSDTNGQSDRTGIICDETRDEHFALGDDLAKIMNPGVQIYTWYDSVPCAFKELPLRADSSMSIPLGVIAEEAGNYTFALDTSMTFFYGAAMLHDKQNNQYHPLNENGVQIALTEGEDNTRFEIVVVPSEIPAELEDVETSETLDAYVHDGRLVVENIEEGSTLSIYDISGKLVYSTSAAGDFNYNFGARGVYMVVLRGNTTGTIKVVY